MTPTQRKTQLFEDIVRLRRAERASPRSRELVTVRTHLEQALGPTVTRALAARLLGVSQTALGRWWATGDLPLVITPVRAAGSPGRDGRGAL